MPDRDGSASTRSRGGTDDGAVAAARHEHERNPQAPAPLFRLCVLLLERGDASVSALLPLLEQFPEFHNGWIALGETLLRLKHPQGARAAFARPLRHQPPSIGAVLGSARALLDLDQHEEAVALLESNRVAWPRDADVLGERGRLLYRAGALAAARPVLETATGIDPHNAQAWFRLGLVHQDSDQPEQAAKAYRRAVEIRPRMYQAALNLGIALQDTGALDAAMEAYRTALRLEPRCYNRVAQALVSASSGRLWLSASALRRTLLGDG